MNLNLAVRDKITAVMGFNQKLSGCLTPCGVEYSIYRGAGKFYIFIALKNESVKKKVHVTLDVLCSAIKKVFLKEYISPLHITEDVVAAICESVDMREKNIEFISGIIRDAAKTSFDIELIPNETYLLVIR